jgi:hypothetical protein
MDSNQLEDASQAAIYSQGGLCNVDHIQDRQGAWCAILVDSV